MHSPIICLLHSLHESEFLFLFLVCPDAADVKLQGCLNGSLPRRHSFGSSPTPPQRGGVRDEPKECLRGRLLKRGIMREQR